jgi:fumarate reductase flavoprotein subunit
MIEGLHKIKYERVDREVGFYHGGSSVHGRLNGQPRARAGSVRALKSGNPANRRAGMANQRKGKARAGRIDVLIAGAGGAGLAAALALAEGGAKVVVFEKTSGAGGTTKFVEGLYAVESREQRIRNIKSTRDEGFDQMMEYSHWRADPRLVRAVVNKSGDTIAWLQKHGVEFKEPHADWLGGPRVWHLLKGFGSDMIAKLLPALENRGVKIRYETRVKRLLTETPNGRVTGAVVEGSDGAEVRVDADAVVIATGGYASNKEWVKKYTGYDLGTDLFEVVSYGKMGDGIQMAWTAGAAEEGTGVLLFNVGMPPATIEPFGHMLGAIVQPSLWINGEGVRFCNEEIIQNMIHTGNAMARQPGRYTFRIFDEEMKRDLEAHGGLNSGNYSPPAMPLTKLGGEIADAVKKRNPYVFVADTLDKLAAKMGVDAKVFRRTVETYNGFCAKARDDEFGKDRAYLRPVKSPKFYAFKCHLDFLCTLGGIKINEKTEVIDTKGKVIPGLYATGCDAGGIYGDSYDIYASGIGSSFAVNSGRIAGESILSYLKGRR